MRCGRAAAAAFATILAGLGYLQAIWPTPLHANDSSASMAAGGLELVKNDQVRMVSEVLRIAPRLVEVDYVFENTGSTDLTTEVAFPLPELSHTVWYYSPLQIPFDRDPNFIGFRVWIDGREIKPNREMRAFVKDREITADLEKLGIDPLFPDLSRTDVVDALRRLGLIIDDGVADHKADATAPVADWSVRISFHWSQTFPAGRRVAVRHSYRPVHGHFYFPVEQPTTKDDLGYGEKWCFDASTKTALLRLFDRQHKAAAKSKDATADFRIWHDNVQYVLTTGANWRGPIGRFELQVDKAGAELVSTCPIPGLSLQHAPYGFNAVADNYTPTSNLDILFVSGRWLGPADGKKD